MENPIPADWYPDPAGTASSRWWNGVAWTDHLRAPEPPAVTAPPPPPAQAAPVADEPVLPTRGQTYADPYASVRPYSPYGYAAAAPTLVYTTQAWWLASTPLWSVVLQLVIEMTGAARSILPIIMVLAALFLSAALTISDRKALVRAGHPTAASTWWWLLTPLAYLIARGVHVYRTTQRGWAPAIVYGALMLGGYVLGFMLLVLISALA